VVKATGQAGHFVIGRRRRPVETDVPIFSRHIRHRGPACGNGRLIQGVSKRCTKVTAPHRIVLSPARKPARRRREATKVDPMVGLRKSDTTGLAPDRDHERYFSGAHSRRSAMTGSTRLARRAASACGYGDTDEDNERGGNSQRIRTSHAHEHPPEHPSRPPALRSFREQVRCRREKKPGSSRGLRHCAPGTDGDPIPISHAWPGTEQAITPVESDGGDGQAMSAAGPSREQGPAARTETCHLLFHGFDVEHRHRRIQGLHFPADRGRAAAWSATSFTTRVMPSCGR